MRRPRKMTTGRIARNTRRAMALLCLAVMVTFLVAGGSALALRLQWIAKVQFVPVVLSAWALMLVVWVLLTLLFGRIYCSVVCPMGILQDIFARLPRMTRLRKFRHGYAYTQPRNGFRYGWLAVIVLSFIVGAPLLLTFFDPYAAFSRVALLVSSPLRPSGVILASTLGVIVAAVTLVAVAVVAAKSGRTICNSVCPVGATLSVASRYSLYGIDINTDTCVGCGLCGRVCKAHCIDTKAHTVDMSRCVVCFDCVEVCDAQAITYTRRKHRLVSPLMTLIRTPKAAPTAFDGTSAPMTKENANDSTTDASRRRFLATGLIFAFTPAVMSIAKQADKLRVITREQDPTEPRRPVTPPGIKSLKSFLNQCVGCAACIEACPAHVLHPATTEYGYSYPMRPVKNYDTSYCRYDCTICTRTCPTGALSPLTLDAKHNFSVGTASVDREACIGCSLCKRHCPRKTITMETIGGRRVAVVNPDGCIGCGECQYVCPAEPHKAITVTGI